MHVLGGSQGRGGLSSPEGLQPAGSQSIAQQQGIGKLAVSGAGCSSDVLNAPVPACKAAGGDIVCMWGGHAWGGRVGGMAGACCELGED